MHLTSENTGLKQNKITNIVKTLQEVVAKSRNEMIRSLSETNINNITKADFEIMVDEVHRMTGMKLKRGLWKWLKKI